MYVLCLSFFFLCNAPVKKVYAGDQNIFNILDYGAVADPRPARTFFHNTFPASISGIPGDFVENVILENFEIVYPGRGHKGLAILPLNRLHNVPETEADYPEFHYVW